MNRSLYSITLYVSQYGAIAAAKAHFKATGQPASFRIISATMRDEDGSVDRGFKVSIQAEGVGHRYYL